MAAQQQAELSKTEQPKSITIAKNNSSTTGWNSNSPKETLRKKPQSTAQIFLLPKWTNTLNPASSEAFIKHFKAKPQGDYNVWPFVLCSLNILLLALEFLGYFFVM